MTSLASRMFEFYCFIKELHDETDCNMRIACRLSKFLLLIERALFDEKKRKKKENTLKKYRKLLFYIVKKNNKLIFFPMFKWFTRKNDVLLTVRCLNETRKQQK